MKRKICIVTGSRAEYGLLYWLMKEIIMDQQLELQLVVTGMHLSPEFGLTYKVIEEDGFEITAKVEMLLSSDTPVGIAKSIGLGVIGFADVFERLKPDILVVLGDRFETFAAVQAALPARIPVAHIHGGETTEGAIDEAIRHAITKMSHLHFVTAEEYQNRVIQMGENPANVIDFGAPGLDNLRRMVLLNRKQFEDSIDFKLGDLNFLVTYHPVTLNEAGPEVAMKELFLALDRFPEAKIIFTKPNADTDGRVIISMIEDYVAQNPNRAVAFTSLGQLRYLSAISHVDVVIGNSSSGVIEVPVMRKPTVNLGDRQAGRIKAVSVIDSVEDAESIIFAINMAISQEFKQRTANVVSPSGDGDTSRKIKEFLKNVKLEGLLRKKFIDVITVG